MKVSHIVYKVNDLEKGVLHFKNKGFKVEFGSMTNPHNALIYFSKGPYIELLEQALLPSYVKAFLKLSGNRKILERLEGWGNVQEGFIDICLEHYDTDFSREKIILKKYQQPYFTTNSKRLDPENRLLKWKLLFPMERKLPFFMTYFNIDPKPKNFIHPNGIKQIKKISFGTSEKLIPLIKELCDDSILNLLIGNGVTNLIYEK